MTRIIDHTVVHSAKICALGHAAVVTGGALPPSGHLLAKAATPFLPSPAAGQPPIVNRSIQGSSESQGRSISGASAVVSSRELRLSPVSRMRPSSDFSANVIYLPR